MNTPRKLLLILIVATGLMISSCQKNYTCVCTITYANGSGTGSETYTVSKSNMKKARKDCQDDSQSADGQTKTCDLQ